MVLPFHHLLVLSAEHAIVLWVLRNLHFFNYLTNGSAVTCTILSCNSNFLRSLAHCCSDSSCSTGELLRFRRKEGAKEGRLCKVWKDGESCLKQYKVCVITSPLNTTVCPFAWVHLWDCTVWLRKQIHNRLFYRCSHRLPSPTRLPSNPSAHLALLLATSDLVALGSPKLSQEMNNLVKIY